jgi:hypothetical protein
LLDKITKPPWQPGKEKNMDDARFIHNESEFKNYAQTGTAWMFESPGYYYSTGEPVTEEMEEEEDGR